MTEKIKDKLTRELPPLCVAVKRVRQTAAMSQEKFAQRYGIATQTISRFERGVQVPVENGVLRRLHRAALDTGLPVDANLFWEAILPDPFDPERQPWEFYATERVYTLQEWRLMQAVRIAMRAYPEAVKKMIEVAAPALAIVDEVLREADTPAELSRGFYFGLEERLDALTDMRILQSFKGGKG